MAKYQKKIRIEKNLIFSIIDKESSEADMDKTDNRMIFLYAYIEPDLFCQKERCFI